MMKMMRVILILAMVGGLSACGYNTQVVSDFNDSALGFTKGYSELMDKSVKWCYESMLLSQLGSGEYTTQAAMQAEIDKTCKGFASDLKTAEASVVVVNTYAAALSALVGVSPQFIEDDAKNLKDAVLKIKERDGKAKLEDKDILPFEQLTNLLSEMITTAAIKDKATDLMRKHSPAVNRQVDIMLAVAKKSVENTAWVAGTTNDNFILNLERVGNLKTPGNKVTNNQAIAYRYLAYLMSQQHPSEESVKDALKKLNAAGESFKIANNDLESKFSTLSKEDQLKSLKDLKSKIEDLRESIQTARK